MINEAILYGFVSMIGFGVGTVLLKYISHNYPVFWTAAIRTGITSSLLLLLAHFTSGIIWPQPTTLLILVFIGLFGGAAYYAFTKALNLGEAAIVSPLSSSYVLLTVLLSVLFFEETPSTLQYVAIILIVAGIIILAFDFRYKNKSEKHSSVGSNTSTSNSKFRKALPFILITATFWGLFYFLLKFISLDVGPVSAAAFIETSVFLFFIPLMLKNKFVRPDFKQISLIALLGITIAGATLSINYAIFKGFVSISIPIQSSASVISLIGGVLFFKERLNLVKSVSLISVIIGLVLITF
ncbi:DMT family transporter [Candidatus Woesearchaeota archaeon]|nr:DMT family transporter [Candidatus Woesearchaeota archaeon]